MDPSCVQAKESQEFELQVEKTTLWARGQAKS